MVKYIALLVIVLSGYLAWTHLPVTHGPGIVAEKAPAVSGLSWEKPFEYKNATLTPYKKIEGKVRIVAKKRYFFDERKRFSPVDVYVSWNKMSDETVLNFVHVNLESRSYNIELTRPPVSLREIKNQSDLWHLVPSNDVLYNKITSLRTGNIIRVKGLLADIESGNNFMWKTARMHEKQNFDEGLILWVEELYVD